MSWFSRTPKIPSGQLVFAIGDIHGCDDLLLALEDKLRAYALTMPEFSVRQIFLGDYIDRGRDSQAVIAHIMAPPPDGWNRTCLRGNHEQMLLDFLAEPAIGPSWIDYINGGRATLHSYGVADPKYFTDMQQARDELAAKMPATQRQFLENLPYSLEVGDYYFVHAGAHPNRKLVDQLPNDQLWIREPFLSSRHDFGKVIVHGHTISAHPQLTPTRIGIDTGAYWSGTLTAIALHGTEQVIIQASRNQIAG
jgi:serine/threonine protein phosphatase 1